ncbi:MAG TPA: ABC transporter substrate-binding protein [Candidatus Paceibacterota bacterium]|nr:ABC transporter substrate-binding protein [Candidatus Paceibacterota bacterium]
MRKYDNQLEDFFGIKAGDPHGGESIKDTITRSLSWRSRLRLLPKVLSIRERYAVLSLVIVAVLAIISIPVTAYYHFTIAVPADGGTLTEGIVGIPRLINPLLAPTNDADRDLASLVYSGLYKYNDKGQLEPDLAKSMPEITSDGLSYSITIRDDARWQDGVPVTADDVIFTVQAAQNQDYGAPLNVRAAFAGIDVKAVSDHVVIFTLRNVYAQFPGNLTLGIMPKHLWEDVKPINFLLSELNLKPVGSGPYEFKSLTKDSAGNIITYKLAANPTFYGGRPHIDELDFKFYNSEDDLIAAFNKNAIDNLSYISGVNVGNLRFPGRVNLEQLKTPSYFAVFFNQTQSKALSDKNVRLALSLATDRVSIINTALGGYGFLINSPMLDGILDINPNVKSYDYDPDQAKAVLKADGWTPDTDGVLMHGKGNRLEISITTSDWSELGSVAQMLKTQWEAVGAEVTVQSLPITSLQQAISGRTYQSLLFGVVMTPDPDPFTIWDSSQREGSGLNFALYSNPTADKLLEDARTTLNPIDRAEKYNEFQNIVIDDIPAIFLYSPHYLYGLSRKVHGFNTTLIATPSDRFADVVQWYLNTKRQFK